MKWIAIGVRDEFLRAGEVAGRNRRVLLVIGVLRVDPLIAGHELAVEHNIIDRLAIDRQRQRLADALVSEDFRGVPLADIDGHALIAELKGRADLEPRVGANILDVGGQRPFEHIELAGAEIREPHGGVGNGRVGNAVDVDIALVPVVREFLDDDAILLHALDELVGSRANRLLAELVAHVLRRLRRDHHAGAIGQLRDQRRERRLQHEPDGQRVDDLHLVDGR